jgi:hypothetical protein
MRMYKAAEKLTLEGMDNYWNTAEKELQIRYPTWYYAVWLWFNRVVLFRTDEKFWGVPQTREVFYKKENYGE